MMILLQKYRPNHFKIGIGFSFQEAESIPGGGPYVSPDSSIWTDKGEIIWR